MRHHYRRGCVAGASARAYHVYAATLCDAAARQRPRVVPQRHTKHALVDLQCGAWGLMLEVGVGGWGWGLRVEVSRCWCTAPAISPPPATTGGKTKSGHVDLLCTQSREGAAAQRAQSSQPGFFGEMVWSSSKRNVCVSPSSLLSPHKNTCAWHVSPERKGKKAAELAAADLQPGCALEQRVPVGRLRSQTAARHTVRCAGCRSSSPNA